jgi:CheY-like chemotaxis protein
MRRVALIVDDDLLVLQTIADMLAELGCEVITRRNATEALATFEQDQRISARLLAGLL